MADALGGALLAVYGIAGRLLMPFMPAILAWRTSRGLEDRNRRPERFGIANGAKPDRPVIWVHAASVGETTAVLPLIGRLAEAGWSVVLTTITVTGAATAARNPPPGVVHQFAPVDVKPWVSRFLDHWRPRLALFVESEVWPVITDGLAARNVPHVIVNARMSERSFRRWRMLGGAPRRVFGRIALALAQSEGDAERWMRLGVCDARSVGNLKFDMPAPRVDTAALEALRAERGDRPLFLAASTHPGEEEVIAEAHALLAERHPGLVTIIVPRHPDRRADISAMLDRRGARHWLRTQHSGLPAESGILVADTLGELAIFYSLVDVAFVGGTLVPVGGHNPAEPIALRAAVIHGPLTGNFASTFAALEAAGGTVRAGGGREIADAVTRLLTDPAVLERQRAAASATMAQSAGALGRTLEALAPFLRRSEGA